LQDYISKHVLSCENLVDPLICLVGESRMQANGFVAECRRDSIDL